MSSDSNINVHDVIRRYGLPISRGDQSIKECLRSFYRGFYLDLKGIVAKDYPADFPSDFYNDLRNKNLSVISAECAMILNILKLEDQGYQLEKLSELMKLLIDNEAFRVDEFYEGSLMARIRPGEGSYERENIFHIPFSDRKCASSQRFSIPGNPCLYLSAYRGGKAHNYEMVKAAWIECAMPSTFTYCIYELQKEIKVLHFGKNGCEYLSEYDYAKDEDTKKDRLEAITQYLLSFPMRAACHISVESKSAKDGDSYQEEYVFPQLLMKWLQMNSNFDGVGYQGASSNVAQRALYIGNLALPARNISVENEYDPYLKEHFKLSEPKIVDLAKELKSDVMATKIEALEKYLQNIEQILSTQEVPTNYLYTNIISSCHSLYQIYFQMAKGNIYSYYDKFVSLYEEMKNIDAQIADCETTGEWPVQRDSSKSLGEIDLEKIQISFRDIVMPVCEEINRIFYLQDCGSFLKKMDFQSI